MFSIMKNSPEDLDKETHEQMIFKDFVRAAGLHVLLGSIHSKEPPLPDISCELDGQLHYFELTRASDQKIANDVGALLKNTYKTGTGGVGQAMSYDDREMLRTAIERKNNKTYKTNGAPIDLLVYYDGVTSPSPLPDLIDETFRSLQTESQTQWNKIWLYDWPNNRILF
jgi:hypothetical protein